MTDYWNAIGRRGQMGLLTAVSLIVVTLGGAAYWLLRDEHVPFATGLTAERMAIVTAEMDREKISYRVGEDGATIEVPQSKLGKARAAASSTSLGLPANVGLEIFKDTDFSTTDFAQRINYQRALQGELTRTIQAIAGVRNARVHVILSEVGVLRRQTTKASAAVEVAMLPGKNLGRAQVRGIQRLVAASVPDIKLDDIVILDESGTTLTRTASESDGELSASQLDLKRQVDSYLEEKLTRLLEDLAPGGSLSLSVDATLDYRQLKITTDEPISTPESKTAEQPSGVLVKERQRVRASGTVIEAGDESAGPETSDFEYEYKVGHRVEQSISHPGSLKRLSVAVALRGAPAGLTVQAVEQLVAHGAGVDRLRGDSVAVLLLDPAPRQQVVPVSVALNEGTRLPPREPHQSKLQELHLAGMPEPVLLALGFGTLFVAAGVAWRRRRPAPASSEAEIEAAAAQVRAWLAEGKAHEPV